jgi:phenylpyruvate tautomerase PptA (4-oxalocrotonate tautomerase family)
MPLYRCIVAPQQSSYDQRAAIARAVTRIHCEVTGGLAMFVHTFFAEDTAGMLPSDKRALMLGSIRAGRTADQKDRLVAELTAALAETLGLAPYCVSVVTVDVPARWVMEGGDILPEPGDEAAWVAKHTTTP